jgi:primosomal protein N' (replication factor Y)
VQSTGARPRARVGERPALVVATPGVEPVPDGSYAAALLLDVDLTLLRPGLRAHEEALRRWYAAAALVRSAPDGGVVVAVGDPAARPVQQLVRWDPWGAAEGELRDRTPLALPPTARVATLTGPPAVVREAAEELARLLSASGADDVALGSPLDLEPEEPGRPGRPAEPQARVLVRAPRRAGPALSAALRALQAGRAARRAGPGLRVQVDPVDLA